MRKTLYIAAREYNETVRTKAFIIGILLAPVLMGGSILAMVLLKGHVDTTDKKVAVVDRSGVVAPALVKAATEHNKTQIFEEKTGKKIKPAYIINVVEPAYEPGAQRLELSKQVENRALTAFVEIGKDVLKPGENPETARITYHSKNAVLDDMRRWIGRPINDRLRSLRLAEAGLDDEKIKGFFRWTPVEALGLVTVDNTGKVQDAKASTELEAFGVPFIMVMLMFLLIMMGAMPLVNSVLEEKTQRISEILLGSAPPFELMMGKLLGNLGVSFTAAFVYIAGGTIAANYMGVMEYVPFHLLPWFFVYLVTAIFMAGGMCIAVGAACNDAKEVQSLMMPVMLPIFLPMFVLVPVIKEPMSSFAVGISLFPPCTPMLMLLRQASPAGIPVWQPIVGLIGVILVTILYVWAAGRIFRIGLLSQGKPPKIRELLRWVAKG